jgi:hypothetical protein
VTHEGRQILYRVAMQVSREWGAALARQDDKNANCPNPVAPFEVYAWHSALEIVDELYNGNVSTYMKSRK